MKSRASFYDQRSMLKNDVGPIIGHLRAQDVTKRDIIRKLDRIAARGDARLKKKPGEVAKSKSLDMLVLSKTRTFSHRPNRVFEMVRAIFRWALSRDILERDETTGLKAPMKKEKLRERVLTPDEIPRFWTNLDAAPITDGLSIALKLALVTAQRIGEASCIALSELDFNNEKPVWNLPGDHSKNGVSHRIPLSPFAVKLIRQADELANGSAYLFPSRLVHGQAIGAGDATKAMQRARPVLDLGDFRVHDLRRTAATGMAELGFNPHTISPCSITSPPKRAPSPAPSTSSTPMTRKSAKPSTPGDAGWRRFWVVERQATVVGSSPSQKTPDEGHDYNSRMKDV